jgi:predicted anti-sigma-YlaC factor YlaD
MNATCDSVERLSLGAYVLGALDPTERAAVDAHLSACPACREELAELAAMPGMLSRVRIEDVIEPEPAPSPAVAERLIERLRAARRARRRRVGGAVAAVGLAAAVAAAIVIGTGSSDVTGPPDNTAQVSASNVRTGVAASFGVRPAPWGTAVRVKLKGVPPRTLCKLIAYAHGGKQEVAGTWRATYDGTADVQGVTSIPRTQLTALEVMTANGHRLVRAGV